MTQEQQTVEQADLDAATEALAKAAHEAVKPGVDALVDFVPTCKMPFVVIVAMDNIGGEALTFMNVPPSIADDMLRRAMVGLTEEYQSATQDAAAKH